MADKILDASEINTIVDVLEKEIDNSKSWLLQFSKSKTTQQKAVRLDSYITNLSEIVKKLKS